MQLNFPSHSFGPRGAAPQPVIMQQGGGSQENKMAKTENLLSDASIQLKDIKNLLMRQLSSHDEIKKRLTELNRNSIAFNAAKIVDPLHRDLTSISSILERIAKATEETAQVAKLSHGLGQSGPVRPSSVVAAARSLDPTSPGGISKKQFNTVLLSATQKTEIYGKETVGLLRKMLNKLQEKVDDIGGVPPWMQDMKQKGFQGLGMLGLAGMFAWNNVIKPHVKQAQLRIQSKFLANKEEREAKVFEELNMAMQSGDPKAIEKARAKLKRGRFGAFIDDIVEKVGQFEGKVDPHNLQRFIAKAKERDQAVPFTRQVAEAIHTGIPLLLSKIIEVLNGGEHMWSYGAGQLVNKQGYKSSNELLDNINVLDAQNRLKSNANIFKSFFIPKDNSENLSDLRKAVFESSQNKIRRSDEVGETASHKLVSNYIGTKTIARNDRDIYKAVTESTGTFIGSAIENVGKAIFGLGKDAVNGVWRNTLLSTAFLLDRSQAGKILFERYIGPLLVVNGHKNIHSFTELLQQSNFGFTDMLEGIKNAVIDISRGHRDITSPITEAIAFFFKIDGNKATPGTKAIIDALDMISKRFKGHKVAKTADWLKNNYINALRGDNKAYNFTKKAGSALQRAPFRLFGRKAKDVSIKDAFSDIASNDPSKLNRLLAGLPSEKQSEMLEHVIPGYENKDSLSQKIDSLKSKNNKDDKLNGKSLVGLRPLIKLIKEDGMKHRRLFIINNKANNVMRDTLLEIKSIIKEIKEKGLIYKEGKSSISSIKNGISNIFTKITTLIPDIFKNGFYVKDIARKVGDSIKNIFTGIKESILKYPRIAIDVIKGAFGRAKDGVLGLIGGVRDIFSKGVSGVSGLIGGAKDFITGKWGSLKDRLRGSISGVTDFFKNKLTATKEKIQEKREEIKETSIKNISKRIDQLYKLISKWFKKQDIKSFFGGIFNGLMGFGKMFTSLLGGLLSGIVSSLTAIMGSLGLGGLATKLFKGGKNIIGGAKNIPEAIKSTSIGSKVLGAGTVASAGMTGASKLSKGAVGALKFGKQALKFVPYAGIAVAIADALYGGYKGYNNTNNIFGIGEGQEATSREKRFGALGGAVGSLAGILDFIPGSSKLANALGFESIEDMVTKGTAKTAKWVSNKGSNLSRSIGGLITGNSARNAVINNLVNSGVIEAGSSVNRINDYTKIKSLSPTQLKQLIDYGIDNPDDLMYVKAVLGEKEKKDIINRGDNAVELQATFDKKTKFDGEVKLSNTSVFSDMLVVLKNIDENTRVMAKAFDSSYSPSNNSNSNNSISKNVDNGSEGGFNTTSGKADQDISNSNALKKASDHVSGAKEQGTLNPTSLNGKTVAVAAN